MNAPASTLSVGISTRNRPEALLRCLRSLRLLGEGVAEVVVVDDGSDPPVEGPVRAALGAEPLPRVRFIRHPRSLNVAAARNRIAREASTQWLLNLDDDAFIVSAQAVRDALAVLEHDPGVGAVGFAQGDAEGIAFPPEAQGDLAQEACYIPAFVGFAHLVRREAFLAVGGFSERMGINGEEKDFCLRLLDAGFRVVYLPHAVVGHVADHAGRDTRRYLHQTVRNTALGALYSEPFPLVLGGVTLRLWRYFAMRRGWRVHDPGGFGRIVGGLLRELPAVLRERRPVRWSTLRRWRRMTAAPPEPYPPQEGVAALMQEGAR